MRRAVYIFAVLGMAIALSEPALADETAVNESVLDLLEENEPLSFSGHLVSTAGGAVGWATNPIKAGFANTDSIAGLSLANSLSFDARPDSDFRVHGSVSMAYPSYSLGIGELFFDYSIQDALFLRIGKQDVSWGSARVFRVGNLMDKPVIDLAGSRTAAQLALKAYLPFGANGFTLLALAAGNTSLSLNPPSFAAKLDVALGKFEFAEDLLWRSDNSYHFSSSAKTSVTGIDFYAQVFGSWLLHSVPTVSTIGNAYWEASSLRLKVFAEYWYNGASGVVGDHRVALGTAWNPAEGVDLKVGLLGIHAIIDASGIIMPVLTYVPRSGVSLSCGALYSYGPENSLYLFALPPGYTLPFTWNKKLSFLVTADIILDY